VELRETRRPSQRQPTPSELDDDEEYCDPEEDAMMWQEFENMQRDRWNSIPTWALDPEMRMFPNVTQYWNDRIRRGLSGPPWLKLRPRR
jgi:hypothetical protein